MSDTSNNGPPSPAALLYGSASNAAKPTTTTTTPTAAQKPAAASAPAAPAAKPTPGTWQAPAGEQPAAPQPEAKAPEPAASPAATLYDAPLAADELASVLRLPDDPAAAGFDTTPEARAERQAFRDALVAEGVNRAEAEAVWQHAVASAAPSYTAPDYSVAEQQLRAEWGAEFDANLARARKAVQRIVAKVPGVKDHLLNTGAHNDPALVKTLARIGRKRGW